MDGRAGEIGILLTENFITEEEEAELLLHIEPLPKKTSKKETRNSVRRYGSNLPYKGFHTSDEIPEFLKVIISKLQVEGKTGEINHVTINEYLPGQGISWHIDSRESGEVITVLSLLSEAKSNFRTTDKAELITLILPPRSLLQMKGEARKIWEHNISPVKSRRYSLVFRKA